MPCFVLGPLSPEGPMREYGADELCKGLRAGQSMAEEGAVLHYGGVPHTPLEKWNFRVFGLVENPMTWSYEEFLALPHGKTQSVDIHCVTRWSKFDNVFE